MASQRNSTPVDIANQLSIGVEQVLEIVRKIEHMGESHESTPITPSIRKVMEPDLKRKRLLSDLPLKFWGLKNFKSVRESGVYLAPLTVVVGQNSAGKSSLLQSLLFFAQNSSVNGTKIPLNGVLYRAGLYSDLLNAECDKNLGFIEFSGKFSIKPPISTRRISGVGKMDVDYRLTANSAEGSSPNLDIHGIHFELHDNSGGFMILNTEINSQQDLPADNAEGSNAEGSIFDFLGNFAGQYAIQFSEQSDFVDSSLPLRSHIASSWNVTEMKFQQTAVKGMMPFEGIANTTLLDDMVNSLFRTGGGFGQGKVRNKREESRNKVQFKNVKFLGELSEVSPPREKFIEDFVARWVGILTEASNDEIQNQYVFGNREGDLVTFSSEMTDEDKSRFLMWASRGAREGLVDRMQLELENHIYGVLEANSVDDLMQDYRTLVVAVCQLLLQRGFDADLNSDKLHRGSFVNLDELIGVRGASDNAVSFFGNRVRYLGPLRKEPQFSYSQDAITTANTPLGLRGENTFWHLSQQASKRRYVLPEGSVGEKTSLIEATNSWIRNFFGEEFELKLGSQDQHGVSVSFGNQSLPHVGVGVSQLLPVLVICLTAKTGDIVLLEQPELHLHPALQQKLADFLLAMAGSGRQIIVETHSEYLITRLRLRTVEDRDTAELFNIVFASNDPEKGTTYTSTQVDENGSLDYWPDGFFDEATSDLEKMMDIVLNRE